jgi:hypothetical protein
VAKVVIESGTAGTADDGHQWFVPPSRAALGHGRRDGHLERIRAVVVGAVGALLQLVQKHAMTKRLRPPSAGRPPAIA